MTQWGLQSSVGSAANTISVWPNQWDNTYHYHYCTCHTQIVREKISLTLEEIDRLRAIAKADPEIRTILQKMAKLIDVEVSF